MEFNMSWAAIGGVVGVFIAVLVAVISPSRKNSKWWRVDFDMENKMKKKLNNPNISNAILWAAAILSGAILDAPQFLTIIILPLLGALSIVNVKRCSK